MSETYKQLSIVDVLMSSQVDSLANHTPSQESGRVKTTNGICGLRCLELYESVHRRGSWERTFAGLLLGTTDLFSRRCVLTLKLVGTPYNRLYFQLVPSTLPTDETECGSLHTAILPTPTTDERDAKYKQGGTNLRAAIKEFLPTPLASDGTKLTGSDTENQMSLTKLARKQMLPTPVASDHHLRWPTENWKGDSDLPSVINGINGTRSQLNPQFVEEMMGFPENWTLSPFQNGERNQSKPTETR